MSISPTRKVRQTQIGCVVTPYKKRRSNMLEQYTGIYDSVYHRYNGYVGFLLPYHGSNAFITYRRELDFLARALPDYEVENEPLIRAKEFHSQYSFTTISGMRAVQSEIIGMIESEKKYNNVWFVNLQTDAGKTILSTYVSLTFGLKTWICCYSKDILHQWLDTIYEKTNVPEERVLVVTGSIIDKILSLAIDCDDYDIFVSTPRTLDALGDARSNYERIGDLFKYCGIGLFIYDEAHRWVSDFVKIMACANPRYILALSADFSQGDHEKEDMFRQVFRNTRVLIPSSESQEMLKTTMVRVIYFDSHPVGVETNAIYSRYGYDAILYAKYEWKKEIMLKAILYILHAAMDNRPYECKDRALVLFTSVDHVNEFAIICTKHFPQFQVGRFHGDLGYNEKKLTKETADIIVATYGSFSTGLHTHDIKHIITTNQCNKVADNQSAGRSTNAYYYMLVDRGFNYCVRKLKTRIQYLSQTRAKGEIKSFTYHPDIHPVEI